VSVVFQNYALFPHLNVSENVAFGLKARGIAPSEIPSAVENALALVRMSDFAGRPVGALSGGQQQRVAVARALVVEPDLLLLDEPFSALDRKLRETMQVELKSLLKTKGMTAVFVTHDQEEALSVSNRVAVMNGGRIEQYADPVTLYTRPASAFVLDFVGLSTHLAGTVT
ncbi:MAG: ABC transporter ATP-binding protein, partial [Roseibium sp.]|nr:ABC transporter ATP-binding protein [Roseibium sp.]